MDWTQLFNDFSAKYKGCFAHVTLEGHTTPELFVLDEVSPSLEAPYLHFINDTTGEIILKYNDSNSDVDWKFPAVGLFSFDKRVLMVRRRYSRQWKGGICDATISMHDLYHRMHPAFHRSIVEFDSLKEAFKPRVPIALDVGIKSLKDRASVALSSEFAIGNSITNDEQIVLFYFTSPIATVSVESKYIHLQEKQFRQEFEDFTHSIAGVDKYEIRS